MSISPTTNSIPFHIAQAYGVRTAPRASAVEKVGRTEPLGRIQPAEAQPAETASQRRTTLDRLVGAVVPGKVDFSASVPSQNTSGSLPFYSRPGDLNQAAVAIQAGRRLDVEG